MKSSYDILGNHIRLVDYRNRDLVSDKVLGINIDKYFMPSVANVIGTDLSKYKLISKGLFACNPMHVGRDERLPVALYTDDTPAIVSPAYFMFEVIDNTKLNEEFLMMWFRRPEFDRICWLKTDGSVRGGITWNDICRIELPVPPLDEQLRIVSSYKAITDRITLKQRINDNLETILATRFSQMRNNADSRDTICLEKLINFGNGKARPSSVGNIPVYGGNGVLSYTDCYNAENVVLIGRVGAYCGSVYIEEQQCWVSDNAIVAKSIITNDEFFDYFLLKGFNLYDHHVGTGQQLLTQGILNSLECPSFNKEEIEAFNKEAKPLFSMINNNNKEIRMLNKTASILLSRLSN